MEALSISIDRGGVQSLATVFGYTSDLSLDEHLSCAFALPYSAMMSHMMAMREVP